MFFKRKIIVICLAVVLLLIVGIASFIIYHYRPIIPDSSIHAAGRIGEEQLTFNAYRRLFHADDIYVRTPHLWIIVNPEKHFVCEPVAGIGTFPYLWRKHDQRLGVPLSDSIKHEDPSYQIIWREHHVQIMQTWKNAKNRSNEFRIEW